VENQVKNQLAFVVFVSFLIVGFSPIKVLASDSHVKNIQNRLKNCSLDQTVKSLGDVKPSNLKTKVICNQTKPGYIPITEPMIRKAIKAVGVNKIYLGLVILGV
jgi:hypothetical protein